MNVVHAILAALFAVLFAVFFVYVALQLKSPEPKYGPRDDRDKNNPDRKT